MAGADEQAVELYLEAYIESYMAACKVQKPQTVPPIAKGYPFQVTSFILPNGAVACLFRPNAASPRIEVLREGYEQARAAIQKKEHSVMLAFPPLKDFTSDDAGKDAAIEITQDTRASAYRTGLDTARTGLAEIGTQIKEIAKTNPWLERQLLAVADKLSSTGEPLDKLIGELGRMQGEERFADDEIRLAELQKYRTGNPPLADITEQVF